MTLTRRPTPFADVVSFRDAIERMFADRLFRPIWPETEAREITPAIDLYTTADAVIAKIALPGVNSEDVDVVIGDDIVTVSGSFKEEAETTEAGYLRMELSRGSFSRRFSIPATIRPDDATAQFRDGLLTLTLPKTEAVEPKHVKVEVT